MRLLCGKSDATKLDFAILLEVDFQHLVCQIAVLYKFVKNEIEDLTLQIKVQSERSVDADEAGVKAHVCIFPCRARLVCRTTEVDAVVGDECPIAVDNGRLKLPILLAALA